MQDVEKVIKRSRRYWYVDGITELYMGSISILAGLFYLGFEGINALLIIFFGDPIANPSFFFRYLALPLLISYLILFTSLVWLTLFLQQRATKFRESFTYPRIGYLAPRTSKRAPNLILATTFIGIQLLLAYMFINPLITSTFPGISANTLLLVGCLCFSCLYLYPAVSSALTRFYVLSAVSTLLSIVLFQTSIRPAMNMVLYTTFMGVALVVSGGFTFQNFSRQNPLSQEELVTFNDLDNAEQDIEEKMTNEEIQKVINRSSQYWLVDGIGELLVGGQWSCLGLFQLIFMGIGELTRSLYFVPPPQKPLIDWSQYTLLQNGSILIFSLLLGCGSIIITRRLIQLRERFCFPRLRYLIAYPPASKPKLKLKTFKLIGTVFVFIQFLIVLIMYTFAPPNISMFVVCLSFSFLFLSLAVSLALNRFYILTALSVLLSIVLFQGKSVGNGMQLYMTLMGVALIISGGLTFRNFLHQNPLPQEELE